MLLNSADIKELLINADVNIIDKYGYTSLMYASHHGYLDIVKELLLNEANVNIKNNYGNSSLMYASKKGYLNIVKELLKRC